VSDSASREVSPALERAYQFLAPGAPRSGTADGAALDGLSARRSNRWIHLTPRGIDKAVAVEVVGGLEREERGHPHHHRAQGFVAEVEVVVREGGLIDAGGYVIAGVDKDGRCERTFIENNINATLDLSPARFLKYDIFRKSKDYAKGRQRQLFQELDDLIDYYRNKAKRAPLLFAICAPRILRLSSTVCSGSALPGWTPIG
jgi:hypothetical protein